VGEEDGEAEVTADEELSADRFNAVCDVIERNYHGWPIEAIDHDGISHTSKAARATAMRIFAILGIDP
jgi:hypothetical protein